MRLALFGPPGAGKGTQSLLLKEQFGLDVISTGNLIRTAIRNGTPLGRQVEAHVHAGGLVPDELVRDLANEAIAAHAFDNFILDGYPRTTRQARWLTSFLEAYKAPLEAVIFLKVSDEAIVERLSNRRIHQQTGESYHLILHPPPAHVDPRLIVQRADDAPESVLSRLETYRKETQPVEAYFREAGLLLEIEGEGTVQDIYARIGTHIEQLAELQAA
ncbi:MAG: adenylate kinase [Bacteroidetes bacterium]|nr:adenylate kinase [Bacteroidota bacterium]